MAKKTSVQMKILRVIIPFVTAFENSLTELAQSAEKNAATNPVEHNSK